MESSDSSSWKKPKLNGHQFGEIISKLVFPPSMEGVEHLRNQQNRAIESNIARAKGEDPDFSTEHVSKNDALENILNPAIDKFDENLAKLANIKGIKPRIGEKWDSLNLEDQGMSPAIIERLLKGQKNNF
jgi:hypothetical protein